MEPLTSYICSFCLKWIIRSSQTLWHKTLLGIQLIPPFINPWLYLSVFVLLFSLRFCSLRSVSKVTLRLEAAATRSSVRDSKSQFYLFIFGCFFLLFASKVWKMFGAVKQLFPPPQLNLRNSIGFAFLYLALRRRSSSRWCLPIIIPSTKSEKQQDFSAHCQKSRVVLRSKHI